MASAAFRLVLHTLTAAGADPLLHRPLAELRAGLEEKVRRLSRRDRRRLLPDVEEGLVWVDPACAPRPGQALLFIHGGAFCSGSVELYSGLAGRLADATRMRTALARYRLAPEQPFPAALEDVEGAYLRVLASGVDAARLVVVGDSAGGGLATSSLARLGRRGHPMPAGLVLLSPWVDLTLSGSSLRDNASADPVVSELGLRRLAQAYLGDGDATHPDASPLFGCLRGMPPCLIQVGAREILLSDATRLAAALERDGVESVLDVRTDMFHGFYVMAELPEAQEAVAALAQFVARRLAQRRPELEAPFQDTTSMGPPLSPPGER